MENPFVSIILTNYNGLEYLEECFNSIYNLNYQNFEIIFVDNNSSDNSIKFVKKNYPKVKIIQNKKDVGFSGANNVGVLHAEGKYLVLLNIDTIVDKNWLKELVNTANSSEKIGIIGSKIYSYRRQTIINFAGGSTNFYGKGSHIGMSSKDCELLNRKKITFYICGASLLIKKELYNKVGLFDPIYYGYHEDLDLCWRTWMMGYKVIYEPKSFLYHKISSVFKNKDRRKYLTEKNRLRTILKNYEFKTLIKILPGYFSDIINQLLNFRYYNPPHYKKLVKIYLRLILWNILHIFSLIRNRIRIQRIRLKDDRFIFSIMKKSQ